VRDQNKWIYRLYKRKKGNDSSIKTERLLQNSSEAVAKFLMPSDSVTVESC